MAKVALVTGAGHGLGAAMTRVLLDAGYDVAGFDIDEAALAREWAVPPPRFLALLGDVASGRDCTAAGERTAAHFGGIDILVNNAGIGPAAARPQGFEGRLRFWEADRAGWRRTIEANAIGPFLMARAVVPNMIEKGWGRVVNITTSYDTMLAPGFCAYGPSKAALEASTVLWASELGGTGVTANVLIPGGPTDTGHPEFAHLRGKGVLLQPSVLAAPLRWLASEAADGVTGKRFVARHWDENTPPGKAMSDAGWPDLAAGAGTPRL